MAKEKLYTIELNDAVRSCGECLFCTLEQKLEQEGVEFVLGSSYMESDTREQTSRAGFCRRHTRLLYSYGNNLGNAWILKSRLEQVRKELNAGSVREKPLKPKKARILPLRANRAADGVFQEAVRGPQEGCYLCGRIRPVFGRMLHTFTYLLERDADFGRELMLGRGFCLRHYAQVQRALETDLPPALCADWEGKLSRLMMDNLDRVQEDINWLIEKYDYRNAAADWRQSRDAVPRAMQKLTGEDPTFEIKKQR